MRNNNGNDISIWEEVKGQAVKNRHHVAKILIAVILIPGTTMVLDNYVFTGFTPLWVPMIISTWATYVITTLYDRVLTRESKRAKAQIIRNTFDILVIKEDVKALQKEVYKEESKKIRQKNMEIAMKRRGSIYPWEVENAKKTKDNPTK